MKRTPLISTALALLLLAASSLALAGGPHHRGHDYYDRGVPHGAYGTRDYGHRHGDHRRGHVYRHGYRHGYQEGSPYRYGYAHPPRHRHGPHCRHPAYPAVRPGVVIAPAYPYPYPYPYLRPFRPAPGGYISLHFDF